MTIEIWDGEKHIDVLFVEIYISKLYCASYCFDNKRYNSAKISFWENSYKVFISIPTQTILLPEQYYDILFRNKYTYDFYLLIKEVFFLD